MTEAYPRCEEILPHFKSYFTDEVRIILADSPFSALPKLSLGLCEYRVGAPGSTSRYLSIVRDNLLPPIDYSQAGISELTKIDNMKMGSFEVCLFTIPEDAMNLGRIDLAKFTGDMQVQFALEAKNRVDKFMEEGIVSREDIVKRYGTVYSAFLISANENKLLSLLQCQ